MKKIIQNFPITTSDQPKMGSGTDGDLGDTSKSNEVSEHYHKATVSSLNYLVASFLLICKKIRIWLNLIFLWRHQGMFLEQKSTHSFDKKLDIVIEHWLHSCWDFKLSEKFNLNFENSGETDFI